MPRMRSSAEPPSCLPTSNLLSRFAMKLGCTSGTSSVSGCRPSRSPAPPTPWTTSPQPPAATPSPETHTDACRYMRRTATTIYFAQRLRPNPRLAPREIYERKAARWFNQWPDLIVDPWPVSRPECRAREPIASAIGRKRLTRKTTSRSDAFDQAHQSAQLLLEGRSDCRRLRAWHQWQSHDHDTATAGPRYRADVGTSLTARGDLAQVVNGARIPVRDDSKGEVPTTLPRAPARLVSTSDLVGKIGRPVRDARRVGEQCHDVPGIGLALDALCLGPIVHITSARADDPGRHARGFGFLSGIERMPRWRPPSSRQPRTGPFVANQGSHRSRRCPCLLY